ncbi:gliding motility-associated ABC transporter substrate-binding protein GldG, partial [Pseudoxanthomonas sp. SGD-10]
MVNQRKRDLTNLLLVVAIIVFVNIISSHYFTRIDFTKEKRFTISETSRRILKDIKEPLYVTVYLEGKFPSGFKRLRNATKDLLVDFRAYSGKNIQFHFIDPLAGKNQEEQQYVYEELYASGIEPTNLNVKTEDGMSQK